MVSKLEKKIIFNSVPVRLGWSKITNRMLKKSIIGIVPSKLFIHRLQILPNCRIVIYLTCYRNNQENLIVTMRVLKGAVHNGRPQNFPYF